MTPSGRRIDWRYVDLNGLTREQFRAQFEVEREEREVNEKNIKISIDGGDLVFITIVVCLTAIVITAICVTGSIEWLKP